MQTRRIYGSPHRELSNPPSDDFGKPHVLLLAHPPEELATYLTYQQTFAFETSKEGGQKKIAFHALPFDKSVQTWIITDISGSYVTTDRYAKPSALATIKTVLSRDRDFRNVVDRCYAETASPLDLNDRVEDALHSFHLTTTALPQQGKEDRTVWQLMAKPISSNHNHQNKWVSVIRNATYLVDHIFPLETHRVIKRCDFCKNETHPHYTCPFPLVEGWKGPTPEEVLGSRDSQDTRRPRTNTRGGGRGGRGGRGSRGGRGRGTGAPPIVGSGTHKRSRK